MFARTSWQMSRMSRTNTARVAVTIRPTGYSSLTVGNPGACGVIYTKYLIVLMKTAFEIACEAYQLRKQTEHRAFLRQLQREMAPVSAVAPRRRYLSPCFSQTAPAPTGSGSE